MKSLKKVLVFCLLVVLSVTLFTACSAEGSNQPVKFTITFDVNASDAQFVPVGNIQDTKVSFIGEQRITSLPKATRKGFDFLGWYFNKECTPDQAVHNGHFAFSKDTTLYAKWGERREYTLNFYLKDDRSTETPLIYTFTGFSDEKMKGIDLKNACDTYWEAHKNDANMKNRRLGTLFVSNVNEAPQLTNGTSVAIEDIMQFVNENGEINYYVGLSTIIHEINFRNKNDIICITQINEKDKVDFAVAYKMVNGKRVDLTDNDFEIVQGKRVMPKAVADTGEVVDKNRCWQVLLTDDTKLYYNYQGYQLDNLNKPTDKTFIDSINYNEVKKITLLTSAEKYSITYLNEDGSVIEVKNNIPANTLLNTFPDPNKIKDIENNEIVGWRYAESYKFTGPVKDKVTGKYKGVSKGQNVDKNLHYLRENTTIQVILKEKINRVKFILDAPKYQHFDTPEPTSVMEYKEKDIKDFFASYQAGTGIADTFNRVVGGTYYIYPNVDVPILSETPPYKKSKEMKDLEFKYLKSQYKLVAFVDKNQNVIMNVEHILEGDVVKHKITMAPNASLVFENFELKLYPKFEQKIDNEVRIQLADGESTNAGEEVSKNERLLYARFTPRGNNTFINNLTATKQGYRFVKWEVTDTPFSKCGPVIDAETNEAYGDGSFYNGVVFNNEYPVLGTTYIKPVFEIDNYTLTFKDTFGNDVFLNDVDKITGNLEKQLSKDQYDRIRAKEAKLRPNVPNTDKSIYVFDDWYTTIITEHGQEEISLTQFYNNGKGRFINQNLTFTARYIDKPYDIIYKEIVNDSVNNFDTYKSQHDLKYNTLLTQTDAINKNGLRASYKDKFGNVFNNSIVNDYKPTELVYKDKKGKSQCHIIGWKYNSKDSQVKADKNGKKWKQFTATTSTDDIVLENGAVVLYPLFQEFDVTLNAGGGYFVIKDSSGNITNQSTYPEKIKGDFFGFEYPKVDLVRDNYELSPKNRNIIVKQEVIYDDFGNVVEDKRVKYLCESNCVVYDAIAKKYVHLLNENITVTANWIPIKHNVTIKFFNTNKLPLTNSELEKLGVAFDKKTGTLTLIGDVERIYLEDTADERFKKVTLNTIMELATFGKNPAELYKAQVYAYDPVQNTETLDLSFGTVKQDKIYHVYLNYEKFQLTLDANGGVYKGDAIDGKEWLETYIDEVTAINQLYKKADPNIPNDKDVYTAYLTKKQEHSDYYTDQGIPVKDGYIFAGFSTKRAGVDKKAGGAFYTIKDVLTTTKIYYGYSNHQEIREDIFGIIPSSNIIWLGDKNLRKFAEGDIFKTEYNAEGEAIKVNRLSRLYAIWVPVMAKTTYHMKDNAETQIDITKILGSTEVDGLKGYNGNNYILVEPNMPFVNPYNYDTIKENDNIINWAFTKGMSDAIAPELLAKDYITKDTKKYTFVNENDVYFTAPVRLYEILSNVETVINVTYVKNDGTKTEDFNKMATDYFVNDFNDVTKYPLVLGDGTNGGPVGTVVRRTYKANGLLIDQYLNQQTIQIANAIKSLNGSLQEVNGKYKYVYNVTASETTEALPIYFNTTYTIKGSMSGLGTVSHKNAYNKPVKNTFYDEKTMATDITGPDGQITKNYNYDKAIKIRLVKTGNTLEVQRLVWKATKGSQVKELEPDILDLSKNLQLGGNVDFAFDGSDRSNIIVEKIDGVWAVVVDAEVFGYWEKVTTSSLDFYVDYVYTKAGADKTTIIHEMEENPETQQQQIKKYLISTGDETFFNLKLDPSVDNSIVLTPSQNRIWKIGGKNIENIDKTKLKVIDAIGSGMFVDSCVRDSSVEQGNTFKITLKFVAYEEIVNKGQ